jgi:hypothetical protein
MSLYTDFKQQIETKMGARIVVKQDYWLMKLINKLVSIWDPNFMEDSATTIGRTIAIPRDWFPDEADEGELYITLRHEAQHVHDWINFKFFMWLTYLGPIPIGPLNLRWFWEYRAYLEGLWATQLIYRKVTDSDIEWVADQLVSSMYLWCGWPFRKLFMKALRKQKDRINA